MKNFLIYPLLTLYLTIIFLPGIVFAHQPRIVSNDFTVISNPEISQAFYGELKGVPAEFQIKSDSEFSLYVGILVPDIPNIKKDISVEIYKIDGEKKEMLAMLDGTKFDWFAFYEEFGGDNYFWGPEYKAEESLTAIGLMGKIVPAGDYRIKVYSPSNLGKYSLVTGYLESFPFTEILNALILVPKLKLNFFNKPLSEILFAPFVLGPVILVSLLSVGAYILRLKYKNLYPKKNTVRDNDLKIF